MINARRRGRETSNAPTDAERALPNCGPHLADTIPPPKAMSDVHLAVVVLFEMARGPIIPLKKRTSHGSEGKARAHLLEPCVDLGDR